MENLKLIFALFIPNVPPAPPTKDSIENRPQCWLAMLDEGRCIYTVYVMSDSYLGLDQQYDVFLQVEGKLIFKD